VRDRVAGFPSFVLRNCLEDFQVSLTQSSPLSAPPENEPPLSFSDGPDLEKRPWAFVLLGPTPNLRLETVAAPHR